ncbi:MAG: WD domain, G-beta repeat/Pentapeptide repeats (8 copies)/NACHT domain, partial [Phormidesmis priestleyi Ana]
MELLKVIPIVLRAIASPAAKQVQRNQLFIKTLKDCGLDAEHPPADFSGIYAYTLVEYGLADEAGKAEALLRLFAEPAIKEAFKQAFDRWDVTPLGSALAERLDWQDYGNEWNGIGNAIRAQNIDMQQEGKLFFAAFIGVVKRSQTPKEQLQTVILSEIQKEIKQLRAQLSPVIDQMNSLAEQLDAWFEVLGYGQEAHQVTAEKFFERIITIPVRRKRYDRVVVRGVEGEAKIADLRSLQESVEQHKADEGWLVSNMRVSSGVRKAVKDDEQYEAISCYTLDELLDEDADFSNYLAWLEEEITSRQIDANYISLGCSKEEIDPKTKVLLGVSHYGEAEGWIEGYVDQWLADSSKEHLSVLGEFGTGKTWFVMHYAWLALQEYKEAKRKGIARPRLPLVIPLRDYAKAVSMESLFSEFFFRKHEIPLPGYSAFEQLNKMGKLLLIFDGFDEMAARVDRQAMIDNFWELARVVVPGAKAILTCRTEHFPDAIEGRETLGAERKASTAKLTGEPPQFEVLELAKFDDGQIAQLLGHKANEAAVQQVMGNPQLLDLARRPVMVDLILEALPDIEAGKPVDMARVYLYAVTRKMKTDIKSERTFTSLADKLYFLCELSWEMLSTDQMSLNYRAFPARLQQMFAERVKEEKELDHWRYDMMGQTMLIRNSEGDYSPAHRSLLEFFVAYKIVASLGALAADFTAVAQQQSHLDEALPSSDYTWDGYFRRLCNEQGEPAMIAGLQRFAQMSLDELLPLLGQSKLAKAVLDLAHPMLAEVTMREQLLPLLQATAQRTLKAVGYLGGNVAQLMLAKTPHALIDTDLRGAKLQGVDFSKTFLRRVNLREAQLAEAPFSTVLGGVNSVAYSPDGTHLAIGDSKGTLQVWDVATGQIVLIYSAHSQGINSVVYSPDGEQLASGSSDNTVKLWNAASGDCIRTLSGHENLVWSVVYSPDGEQLASGSADKTVKLWNAASGDCIRTLSGHENGVWSVVYSPDGEQLASGSSDKTVKLWNAASGDCIRT